jgi:hypothetical protein
MKPPAKTGVNRGDNGGEFPIAPALRAATGPF